VSDVQLCALSMASMGAPLLLGGSAAGPTWQIKMGRSLAQT